MARFVCVVLLCLAAASVCDGAGFLRRVYPRHKQATNEVGDDVGDALYLTPYITAGNITGGQQAALVTGLEFDLTSYAGYITVNETCNANLFFWFFPSTVVTEDAPVLIWLQGGPGASSLFGLFAEIGPVVINASYYAELRDISWNTNYNVIYVDNPVGTGYSFTDDNSCYTTNEDEVGDDLYEFLVQFFTLFPEYHDNDFYVTGESYAGKYVPAISYKIFQNNKVEDFQINLQGMAIGDGYVDPVAMMDVGDFLYEIGLVDNKERLTFLYYQQLSTNLVYEQRWEESFRVLDKLYNGDLIGNSTTYYYDVIGYDNYLNYMRVEEPDDQNYYSTYVTQSRVRKAIHVGNIRYDEGDTVEEYLVDDQMQSVKPWVEEMLNSGEIRVLFYNGQLDVICGHTLTQNLLRNLLWDGNAAFRESKREIWHLNDDVAGYFQRAGVLSYVMVRNAGHMVPYDQPAAAFDMITRFIENKTVTDTSPLPTTTPTTTTSTTASPTEATTPGSGNVMTINIALLVICVIQNNVFPLLSK